MKKLVLTIIFVAVSAAAYCCSCSVPSTVEKGFQGSDVVFRGKVISKRIITILDTTIHSFAFDKAEYKLLVLTLFKGQIKEDTVTIITGNGGGDCGYPFKIGNEYIIYGFFESGAYSGGKTVDRVLSTNICTRTRSATDTAEIKALREIIRKRKGGQ